MPKLSWQGIPSFPIPDEDGRIVAIKENDFDYGKLKFIDLSGNCL